jgi:MFS family permease
MQPMQLAQVAPRSEGRVRNTAIGLITLAVFTGTAARYALSPMQELVKADLGLGDNQVALLQGMAIALPTALMSIPIGRLVDRANRTRLLVVLALLCALGSLMTALAHGFGATFAARMLVGAAVVAAQPAALSLVSDLTEPAQRGRMITVVSLGQAFGGTAAYMSAGALLEWLPRQVSAGGLLAGLAPWRLVQLAFALAVLAATVALLAMREPVRREAGSGAGAASEGLGMTLRALAAHRRLLLPLAVGMVSIGMADAAAGIWAVPILTRVFHQNPADFGAWLGMLNLGSGIVGAIVGGLAADLGQRGRGPGGALLGAAFGAALSVPAALFPVMPSVGWFAFLLGVLLAAGACVNIAATSAVMVLLPNRLRGICMSMLVAIIGLVAFGIAPLLVSFSAHWSARGGDLTAPLAVVGVATSLAAVAAFVRAMAVVRDFKQEEST